MDDDLKEKIVAKHDRLIRANFKLTVNQLRLILTLISKIHSIRDVEFERYSFKISDLYRMLKLNKKSIVDRRRHFKNILNGLQKNLIEIIYWEEGNEFLTTPADPLMG